MRDTFSWLASTTESPSFEECVRRELEGDDRHPVTRLNVVGFGMYAEQLRRYLDLFPRKGLLVLEHSELLQRPVETLHEVTDFLALARHTWDGVEGTSVNVNPCESEIDPQTRELLVEHYRPHNLELYELIGRDFGWA